MPLEEREQALRILLSNVSSKKAKVYGIIDLLLQQRNALDSLERQITNKLPLLEVERGLLHDSSDDQAAPVQNPRGESNRAADRPPEQPGQGLLP